jgi:hypothetical protein
VVDAPSDGEEIVVMPSNYYIDGTGSVVVDMSGKAIWLHSSDGAAATRIFGEDARRVIICMTDETEDTIIEGFTIEYGKGVWFDVDEDGVVDELTSKNKTIDWKEAIDDVRRFVPENEQPSLTLWSESLFLSLLEKFNSN